MLAQKSELDQKLALLERQIFALETTYLEVCAVCADWLCVWAL